MSKRLLVPLLTAVLALGSVIPVIAATARDAGVRHAILNMSVAEKFRSARNCLHAEPKVTFPQMQNGLAPTQHFTVRRPFVITDHGPRTTDHGHPPRTPSSNRIRAPDVAPGRS